MVVLNKQTWFVLHLKETDVKWRNPTEVKKKGRDVILNPLSSESHGEVQLFSIDGVPYAAIENRICEVIDLPQFIAEMLGCHEWWKEKVQPKILA